VVNDVVCEINNKTRECYIKLCGKQRVRYRASSSILIVDLVDLAS
jgi:hypothetical protein